MAESVVTAYKTELKPELNPKVDDINYYVNHVSNRLSIPHFQYQKLQLDMTMKIVMEQKYQFGANGYNYLKLEQDNKVYFFFILNSKWIASNTIELTLSMDTINGFVDELEFSNNTHITRQHKDRFIRETLPRVGSAVLTRKVDKESEGLNPLKLYDNNKQRIYDTTLESTGVDAIKKSNWYLIYRTSDTLSPTNYTNPIDCFCTSDYAFNLQDVPVGLQYTDYPSGTCIAVTLADNPSLSTIAIRIGSRSYYLSGPDNVGFLFTFESNLIRIRVVGVGDVFTTSTRFYMLNGSYQPLTVPVKARVVYPSTTSTDAFTFLNYVVGHTQRFVDIKPQGASGTLRTINSIDRTNSQYMKIIELPYPPFNIAFTGNNRQLVTPDGWIISDEMFKLLDLDSPLYKDVCLKQISQMAYPINLSNLNINDSPNKELESKLYNSEFFDYNVKYDNFEKQMFLERFEANSFSECQYDIGFKPTNTINTNFLFEFTTPNDSYKELLNNSQYLNIRRSNELPMFNSDYVNYVRNGYNYDKKSKDLNFGTSLTNAGINFVGSFLQKRVGKAFGASAGVGLAITAISNLVSAVNAKTANERAIQQKLDELKNSPSSVNGSDDIDILNYTTGNKLEVYTNSCSNEMQKAIWNLFRLTGYNCNDYGVPVTDTRLWYNFVQCEPEFNNEEALELPRNVIEDIKAKYQVGVTYFHKVNNNYDFDRKYENYETWIINR